MNVLDKVVKGTEVLLSPLKNNSVSIPIVVILILYSGLIAPNPPDILVKILSYKIVKILALFVLALVFAHGDQKLALMSVVAVIVTIVIADNIQRLNDTAMGIGSSVVNAGTGIVGKLYDGGHIEVKGSSTPNVIDGTPQLPGLSNNGFTQLN